MNLKKNFSEITEIFDEWDYVREEILKIARKIVRDCSIAIKSIHREEIEIYLEKVEIIKENLTKLRDLVDRHPGVFFKYLRTPEQEYAEAVCFYAVVKNHELLRPSELNVDPLNYVLGLADVIGELRRYTLDKIRNSQIQNLNRILEIMDEIYTQLFSLDYPSGLTNELRHKTDVARRIIERTRGDISLSLQMNELSKCIKDNIKS